MASSTDSFTGCSAPAGSSRAVRSGTGHGDALQQFGELHREVDSLADLTCALGVGAGRSEPFELGEEQIEAVGNEPVAKRRIFARARKVGIGNQKTLAHPPTREARFKQQV